MKKGKKSLPKLEESNFKVIQNNKLGQVAGGLTGNTSTVGPSGKTQNDGSDSYPGES